MWFLTLSALSVPPDDNVEKKPTSSKEDFHYPAQESPEEDQGGEEAEEVQSLLRTVQARSPSGEEQLLCLHLLYFRFSISVSNPIQEEILKCSDLERCRELVWVLMKLSTSESFSFFLLVLELSPVKL